MGMKCFQKAMALALAAALMSVFVAGCGSSAPEKPKQSAAQEEKVLVVYTARSESLNNLVIPNFEKDTGIKVQMIVAGTGALQKRVVSEKNNPQGDILWAADQTMLESSKDLFMQYVSPEDANMGDEFKNKSGYFSAAFADPTVLIVNTNLARDIKIESFNDLLNPALKGKIAFGDPANSSSAFQSLMAMLYAKGKNGDPMSEEAWAFVDKFIANLNGKMLNSSGGVHKGVADGEYTVGLTWEDPAANYVKNGAPVKVVFPQEGAIFPGESVQIIKGCKHPENAKKFVDYMLSKKIQEQAGKELTVRPLRKNVELANYMTPIASIKLFSNYDEAWVSNNKTAITARWTQQLEKSMK
jgi:iron(III) transport system substrate-binding protein